MNSTGWNSGLGRQTPQDPRRYGQNRNFQYTYDQYDRDSYNPAPHSFYNCDHWQDTATQQSEYSMTTMRFQDPRPIQDEDNLSLTSFARCMDSACATLTTPSGTCNAHSALRTSCESWPNQKRSRHHPHLHSRRLQHFYGHNLQQ